MAAENVVPHAKHFSTAPRSWGSWLPKLCPHFLTCFSIAGSTGHAKKLAPKE